MFMSAPPHMLNEHVELTKTWVRPQAAGLANGVLREAARRLDAGTLPDPVGGERAAAEGADASHMPGPGRGLRSGPSGAALKGRRRTRKLFGA
jgi:hypothetical protein